MSSNVLFSVSVRIRMRLVLVRWIFIVVVFCWGGIGCVMMCLGLSIGIVCCCIIWVVLEG